MCALNAAACCMRFVRVPCGEQHTHTHTHNEENAGGAPRAYVSLLGGGEARLGLVGDVGRLAPEHGDGAPRLHERVDAVLGRHHQHLLRLHKVRHVSLLVRSPDMIARSCMPCATCAGAACAACHACVCAVSR
jgi:hypothetical protein